MTSVGTDSFEPAGARRSLAMKLAAPDFTFCDLTSTRAKPPDSSGTLKIMYEPWSSPDIRDFGSGSPYLPQPYRWNTSPSWKGNFWTGLSPLAV